MPRKDYRALIQAEGVILDPAATPEQVRAAIAAVDAQNDPEQSRVIRETLQHEAHHRQDAPPGASEGSAGSPAGSGR